MTVIVDANIVITGIVNPYGPIPLIINLNSSTIDFVVPDYLIEEINSHKAKICKLTETSPVLFEQLKNDVLSKTLLFSTDTISQEDIKKAERLTSSIDVKDTWYVAFAIALDALLWTNDLKLYKGLRRKGFSNIVTTKELKEIIKGI